jgi:hypothetical protein
MKVNRGVEIKLQAFKTSLLDKDKWTASRSGRFAPYKQVPVPTEEEGG